MADNRKAAFIEKTTFFVAEFYSKSVKIPRNCIQAAITLFSTFIISLYIPYLKDEFKLLCEKKEHVNFEDISQVLQNNSNPFEMVGTEYRRLQMFNKFKIFSKPIEYSLGIKSLIS